MSNEQRTAIYGVVAALLTAAGTLGLVTADEAEVYGVAAVALLGAASQVMSAVKTWKQRGQAAKITVKVDSSAVAAEVLRRMSPQDFRGSV